MKNEGGITLVALIITIIILLILATVSIKLVLNNGIISKADKSTNQYIEEQIKISYADYKAAKFDNETKTLEEFIEDSLKNKFHNNNIKNVKTSKNTITVTVVTPNKDKIYVYDIRTDVIGETED